MVDEQPLTAGRLRGGRLHGARLHGLVLAAGAGSRLGRPKALMRDEAGVPWVQRAVELLRNAGSDDVTVVLGAAAVEARALVPTGALVVEAADWQLGQSASLRAGLAAVAGRDDPAVGLAAVLITLVDLPGLPAEVARRVVRGGFDDGALRQAVFGGRPGHPALVGREHWAGLAEGLAGDRGARPYLAAHGAREVECGDLGSGEDVDFLS